MKKTLAIAVLSVTLAAGATARADFFSFRGFDSSKFEIACESRLDSAKRACSKAQEDLRSDLEGQLAEKQIEVNFLNCQIACYQAPKSGGLFDSGSLVDVVTGTTCLDKCVNQKAIEEDAFMKSQINDRS